MRCAFFGTELVHASPAAISPRHDTSDPLLHAAFEESQINQVVAHLPTFFDSFVLALRTPLAFYQAQFVVTDRPPSKLAMVFVDSFEVRVGAHEDFLALIIEVGAFGNFLKIFRSVLFRPE
jgi:hypothetical protein